MQAVKSIWVLAAVCLFVPAGTELDALADPPPAFGPITSSEFIFVPGKSIEIPKEGCGNGDVLRMRGPNLGNAKSADVKPATSSWELHAKPTTQAYTCEAPDYLPIYFKIASIWGGQQGSLLFWGWLLTLYSALVVIQNWRKLTSLMPYVVAILMGSGRRSLA